MTEMCCEEDIFVAENDDNGEFVIFCGGCGKRFPVKRPTVVVDYTELRKVVSDHCRCPSTVRHGPGHQSSSRCEITYRHGNEHRDTSLGYILEWEGDEQFIEHWG